MVIYYIFDNKIIRNIDYGHGAKYRNLLDIYLPSSCSNRSSSSSSSSSSNGAPVIIFVSGGAWIIGYKLWSALVGRGLSQLGIICIVPDYRNFPQGNIEDMMTDIKRAIKWTVTNVETYGGDKEKIVLAGQSAGAHICLCTLVDWFVDIQKSKGDHVSKEPETDCEPPKIVVPSLPSLLSLPPSLPIHIVHQDNGTITHLVTPRSSRSNKSYKNGKPICTSDFTSTYSIGSDDDFDNDGFDDVDQDGTNTVKSLHWDDFESDVDNFSAYKPNPGSPTRSEMDEETKRYYASFASLNGGSITPEVSRYDGNESYISDGKHYCNNTLLYHYSNTNNY